MRSIEKTIDFIKEAHAGVFDKVGVPYWLHPFAVYSLLGVDATDTEKHAALLHDIVEDTSYTYDNLHDMGYTEEVIDILKLVTRDVDDHRPYLIWINEIVDSGNISAMRVKKADIEHNMLRERMDLLDEKTHIRLEKKYISGIKRIIEGVEIYVK
jgi:(p)ppGpp synthase/HD superfamily hydrolase